MRCFVAIELDEGVIEAAGDLQDELKEAADLERNEVKWVKPGYRRYTRP
jgi:2'-5' RNA ligase